MGLWGSDRGFNGFLMGLWGFRGFRGVYRVEGLGGPRET